jgi:hypothetical protein
MLAAETSIPSSFPIPIKKPIFFVDIDQTILAGVEAFLNKYPLNAIMEDVYSLDLDLCLGHGMHNVYMNFLNTHNDIPAYSGAIPTIHEMQSIGQLFIVTARPPTQIQRFCEEFPGFNILSKSGNDWPIADLYVDDVPNEILVNHSKFTALIDMPWNRHETRFHRYRSLANAWRKWKQNYSR